jgi:hypothetical protein
LDGGSGFHGCGIATEVEVHLLGNRSLVSAATDTRDQNTNCSVWWALFGYSEVMKKSSFVNSKELFVREFRRQFYS